MAYEKGEKDGQKVMGASLPSAAVKVLDDDARIVKVAVSSDRVDREGDIIKQQGMDYTDHLKTKSILYAHDWGMFSHGNLPIGKLIDHEIKTKRPKGAPSYKITVETHQFNPPGTTELADAAWKCVKFGSLAATSIGFLPTKTHRPETDEERDQLGLGKYGVVFEECQKLETSWVPVPANTDAVMEALGKGAITPSELKLLLPAHAMQASYTHETARGAMNGTEGMVSHGEHRKEPSWEDFCKDVLNILYEEGRDRKFLVVDFNSKGCIDAFLAGKSPEDLRAWVRALL